MPSGIPEHGPGLCVFLCLSVPVCVLNVRVHTCACKCQLKLMNRDLAWVCMFVCVCADVCMQMLAGTPEQGPGLGGYTSYGLVHNYVYTHYV